MVTELVKLEKIPHSVGYLWTDAEREILRTVYNGTVESITAIQSRIYEKTGVMRGVSAIRKKLVALNIGNQAKASSSRRKWTEKEIQILEDSIGKLTLEEIVIKLGRTSYSIIHKAHDMNISFKTRLDWYTLKDTCYLFGVTDTRVRKWIQAGQLKADRMDTTGIYHIKRKDIRNFIINHYYELNGRNLDLMNFIDILIGDND